MLKLKLQYSGHLMQRTNSQGKTHSGKDRGHEKGATENEMIGWHHWLNGHEFEQTPENSEGQGSLACCSSWDCKVWDTTEQLTLSLFILRYAGKNFLIFYTVENFLKFYVYLWRKISPDIEFQVDRFLVLYYFPLSSLTTFHYFLASIISVDVKIAPLMAMCFLPLLQMLSQFSLSDLKN